MFLSLTQEQRYVHKFTEERNKDERENGQKGEMGGKGKLQEWED